MIKFTNKIAIVASLVALYSGEHAFGSNSNNVVEHETGAYNNHLVNNIDKEVWKIILKEASKETRPDQLALVCKKFHYVIRNTAGIPQEPNNQRPNNFLQQCMKIYEANKNLRLFKNEKKLLGNDLYEVLEGVFGDIDSFTTDPELIADKPDFYVTESGLREKVKTASNRLLVLSR